MDIRRATSITSNGLATKSFTPRRQGPPPCLDRGVGGQYLHGKGIVRPVISRKGFQPLEPVDSRYHQFQKCKIGGQFDIGRQGSGRIDRGIVRARLRLVLRSVDGADRMGLRLRPRLGLSVPVDREGR